MRSIRLRHSGAALRHKKRRLAKAPFKAPLRLLGLMLAFFSGIGLMALGYWFYGGGRPMILEVQTIEHTIESHAQIEPFACDRVKPVLYTGRMGLEELSVPERKQRFIEMILPAVLVAKHRQDVIRERVEGILAKHYPSRSDSAYIERLLRHYRTTETEILLSRLYTHPASIALAQAALESGWGTSRLFQEAYNLFGVWSFNPREPRILASGHRGGKPIYLRRYESPAHSIEDYFKTVGTSRSFEQFRNERLTSSDPFHLISFLGLYSEQRELYVNKLHRIVEANNLTRYDQCRLDPSYLKLKAAP
ncbi:MAG: glucosaminidase domain-containing protein [Campylobacterales bacterium]